jgi:hypothetical protein
MLLAIMIFLGDRVFRFHHVWDIVSNRACATGICNLHSSLAPIVPQFGKVFEDQIQM